MFSRNDPASPSFVEKEGDSDEYLNGLTKFERCAMEFTAAWIIRGESEHNAAAAGIVTAEEFCKQMEERERNV